MSLRARMGLVAGAAVAIAVIAVALSAYAGTRSQLLDQVDDSLRGLARPHLFAAQRGAPGGGYGAPVAPSPAQREQECGRGPDRDAGLSLDQGAPPFGGAPGSFTVVCRNGLTYVPPGQQEIPVSSAARDLATRGNGQFFTDETVAGHHIRVLATAVAPVGALLVALPMDEVDSTLSHELLLFGIIAAGGIALAAVLAVLAARTAVAPIVRFTRQTERIAARPDRLERERVEVTGSDELARLARTFNATLDALESSVRAQRNLVADASHELRTPIATIRANIQMLRDEHRLPPSEREALRADVIEELDELTALVADVVELARGSKEPAAPGDVRLDEVLAQALDRARRRASGVSFDASIEPTLLHGDGDRMARALMNLLDNAAKWSPRGGVVEVTLRDGVVTVRDHGPGFHEEDLPFVFDRFHRSSHARSKPGSGLGLAIVKQAAEAHGGFVEAANAPGGGAILRIGFGEPSKVPHELQTSAGG